MTVSDQNPKGKCPYWSAASMKCGICSGGLFIPMDDYVETFCITPHYSACLQYSRNLEKEILLHRKVRKSEENRRKNIRIETSRKITLIKIFESGKLVSNYLPEAKTIDVSESGMRMATRKPLLHDMMIRFSFDDSLPRVFHEVTGKIEWCNKQIDDPGYQAGVSFKEKHIKEAMGRYLGKNKEHA
jgi:hypothetical protein